MLLITGANGKLGRLIVEEVLRRAPDAPLAVSVRDASAAADLAERDVDRLLLMPDARPGSRRARREMIPVSERAIEFGLISLGGLDTGRPGATLDRVDETLAPYASPDLAQLDLVATAAPSGHVPRRRASSVRECWTSGLSWPSAAAKAEAGGS